MTSNGSIARSVLGRVLARVKGANWDAYSPSWRSGPVYERTGLVEHRNALDVCLYVELRTETRARRYPDHRSAYADWSRLTLSKGCGNCAEMAAAAFTLSLEAGAKIVEYAEFEHFDHAFCILGRERGSDLSRAHRSSTVIAEKPFSRINASAALSSFCFATCALGMDQHVPTSWYVC